MTPGYAVRPARYSKGNFVIRPHVARKAGKCASYSAAIAGNAPECCLIIGVGDTYFDGELDPYKAGGFGKDRVCAACREKGYA